MSDSADTAQTAPAATGAAKSTAGAAAGTEQRPPARPVAEVRADIVKERAGLGASFDALRSDLDEAADAGRSRVAELGRKARIVAPAVGAALAVALFLRSRARDRR
jgi:hypothetical protein